MTALIGALRVSLSADTANFEAGMKRAQRQTQTSASAIGKSMGVIKSAVAGFVSGLSVGLFVNVIKGALDYAGSLAEVAQQLGVTTRDLQVFRFAAGQVGVSQEQLETGLTKLTITLGKVAAGAKAPTDALKAIGISADQLKGKDAGEAFRIIADGLQKVTDRSQRAAIEVALFGKSGAMLDNLLSGGSGAINELSAAAEKLGIVLSDEQIKNADDTADKLAALKTVLSANIAGAVANNANAILGLVNALSALIGKLPTVIRAYQAFVAQMNVLGGKLQAHDPTNSAKGQAEGRLRIAVGEAQLRDLQNQQRGGSSAESRAARFRKGLGMGTPTPTPAAGQDIGKFLATGGGGGGGGARRARVGGGGGGEDRSAQDALNKSYQFDQELRSSQMDVLRATQDLAADYVERTAIGIQILDAEKAAKDAELQYQAKLFELTKGKEGMSQAQAAQLKAQNDVTDSLERQKLLQDEEEQRAREYNELDQHDFDRKREVLQSQAAIATTAAERRKIELQLLDLAYQQKKQALQNILDTSKDFKEIEDARRDLSNLKQTYGADRQNVMQQTQGPLEQWAASAPHDAATINEALQSIEAKGLEGLTDAITGVITGTESMKDAFHNLAASILADLIQMTIKMMLFKALEAAMGAFGGGGGSLNLAGGTDFSSSFGAMAGTPGFATGGSFTIGGKGGVDQNVLSLNGLPIARVSHGERINVANDEAPAMSPMTLTMNNDFRGADPSAVASIKAHLDQIEKTFPTRVVATMADAQDRFLWRGRS